MRLSPVLKRVVIGMARRLAFGLMVSEARIFSCATGARTPANHRDRYTARHSAEGPGGSPEPSLPASMTFVPGYSVVKQP